MLAYLPYLNAFLGDKRVKILLSVLLIALCVLVLTDHTLADTVATTGGNGAIEQAGNTLSNLLYNIIGKILFVVFIFGGIIMLWRSAAAAFIMWGMAILLAFATGLSNQIWSMFHQ
jgi:hypothetical protein